MKLKEIFALFDSHAPFSLQESYDNSGIQVGSPEMEIQAALICLEVTDKVVEEAMAKACNLIISHHPLIFSGIKSLTGRTTVERVLLKAILNNIAIFSAHTNFDKFLNGVNSRISDKLDLVNRKVLRPVNGQLLKLSFYVPVEQAEIVRQKIFEAGAGVIGNYDYCSFNVEGTGTFRASDSANPFVGQRGVMHKEKEIKVETVIPSFLSKRIITALLENHPYEEVAYDLYPLLNDHFNIGMGLIGEFRSPLPKLDFLKKLKREFNCGCIRYTNYSGENICKVAVCGGSGSFLLEDALSSGADAFVSADFKYHQFFEGEDKILIADIGHYESEQYTKELFYELVTKKFPKFAVHLSEVNTNPINYL